MRRCWGVGSMATCPVVTREMVVRVHPPQLRRFLWLWCLGLAACTPKLHNPTAATAIEPCSAYIPWEEAPGFPMSSVDRVEGGIAFIIVPNPRSAEGEDDVEIPCRDNP